MSDNDPRAPKEKGQRPNGNDPQFNWRGLVLLAVAFALIGGAFLFRGNALLQVDQLSYPQFEALVSDEKVIATTEKPLELVVEQNSKTEYLTGTYNKQAADGTEVATPFRVDVFTEFNGTAIRDALSAANLPVDVRPESNLWASTLIGLLPIAIFLLVLYFFFRSQIKMAGKGAMSFGKSKAKMMAREKNKITFKDVAGVEEAKDEVSELVEFLKDPKKFQKLGGRIPKGVLMVGPPGTGKTLIARAIAGEADVPFFSISGSDFVEMFVGVGASRVRDMFEQGKKSAPCLIFIDEIDAVGRHRGHGMGGGHDEREQTLNQLLVEMDGFDTQDGVIIIAATNRADVLDPALLRPGRFDRQVNVGLPDVKGREEILRVHSKKVKLAEGVDMSTIAKGTPGYSGAELANVINEAALLAARNGLKAIGQHELEEARDKVRWGKERRSMAMSPREKETTAFHEAGHAILNLLCEHSDPLHKVSIIPRGPALGVTMYLPEGDRYTNHRLELADRLVMIMGGRVAEEIAFGDITNGASGDIRQATQIARSMVCHWGMSDKLGMIEYGSHEDHVFLARDMSSSGRDYSEETARTIDAEVMRIISEAYDRATALLTEHRDKLDLIANALLEYETLDGKQVRELMETGKMSNPPVMEVKPPPLPPPPNATPAPEPKGKKGDDLPPGSLAPAPA
ncbi:MAG: ATP-dependent zinc metalloprotease FtsH [Chthoniobacterales bacterium]